MKPITKAQKIREEEEYKERQNRRFIEEQELLERHKLDVEYWEGEGYFIKTIFNAINATNNATVTQIDEWSIRFTFSQKGKNYKGHVPTTRKSDYRGEPTGLDWFHIKFENYFHTYYITYDKSNNILVATEIPYTKSMSYGMGGSIPEERRKYG